MQKRISRVGQILRQQSDCRECSEGQFSHLKMPKSIWNDIVELRNQYYPNECAVFLILEKDDQENYMVKDYIVPKQIVSRSNVNYYALKDVA